jgi:hypothetical protein
MERAMGIEPTSEAWEALNKTLKAIDLAALRFPNDGLNWKLVGNRKQFTDCDGLVVPIARDEDDVVHALWTMPLPWAHGAATVQLQMLRAGRTACVPSRRSSAFP